jgi:hypothetical protein
MHKSYFDKKSHQRIMNKATRVFETVSIAQYLDQPTDTEPHYLVVEGKQEDDPEHEIFFKIGLIDKTNNIVIYPNCDCVCYKVNTCPLCCKATTILHGDPGIINETFT